MRNVRLLALSTTVLFVTAAPPPKIELAQEQRYVEHLKFLAAPEMEGRGAGTAGLERASDYIAGHFRQMGLQPVGDRGSYKHAFPVSTGAKQGAANRLEKLRLNEDYRPISFSANGKVNSGVVFAGYGATAREFNYDDYAGLAVKDKIVIVLRYEPKSFRKAEAGKKPNFTHHAHVVNKAINARNHGASAVLLVNADGDKDELIEFGRVAGPDDARIPILQVKRLIVDEWLKPLGQTLSRLQDKIESEKAPASIALPEKFKLSLQVDIERPETTVQNVLGYLPGKSKEYIVIGAHYDHIGYGHYSSMAPDQSGKVHPGADDNASGTAGLLELARMFSERRSELDRGILFAAFAGEEVGLIGSAKWVEKPTLPLQNAVAMMNMDMIGRVNGAKLFVGGVGSGSTFDAILKDVLRKYDFKVEQSFKNSSSSDHASFVDKNIPSLFFFSGLHSDYHKPTDTWNKIDTAASSKVVNIVADVVSGLLPADVPRPQFVKPPRRRGADRYFGITPDYKPAAKGLRIDDITSGSAAASAGLQAGDLIVSIDAKPINDTFDLTYALIGKKAGDVVRVQLLRNGKSVTGEVKVT